MTNIYRSVTGIVHGVQLSTGERVNIAVSADFHDRIVDAELLVRDSDYNTILSLSLTEEAVRDVMEVFDLIQSVMCAARMERS